MAATEPTRATNLRPVRVRARSGGSRIPARDQTTAPLSFPQEGLRFLDGLYGGQADHLLNQFDVFEVDACDVRLLEAALAVVVERQHSLRTAFDFGKEQQRVVDPWQPEVVEETVGSDTALGAAVEAAAYGRFDLGAGRMLRSTLVSQRGGPRHLVLSMPHLVSDPASKELLLRELQTAYAALGAGRDVTAPPLRIQYTDFALWQRATIAERLPVQVAYWQDRLSGAGAQTFPFARTQEAWSVTGKALNVTIEADDWGERVGRLARAANAMPFVVVLSSYIATLARLGRLDQVLLATFMAHRPWRDTDTIIGLFAKLALIRTDCSGDPPFIELCGRVREAVVGAIAHNELPLRDLLAIPEILGALNRLRSPWLAVHYYAPTSTGEGGGGLRLRPTDGQFLAKGTEEAVIGPVDLHLSIWDRRTGLACELAYNPEVFPAPAVAGAVASWRRTLLAALDDPHLRLSRLPA